MVFTTGVQIRTGGAPHQAVLNTPAVTAAGIVGSDYPALRLRPLVAEGDTVRAGSPVLEDKRRPGLVLTAPVAGVVEEIAYGPRRQLSLMRFRIEGDGTETVDLPGEMTPETLRALLLKTGLWANLVARPFGRIPDPGTEPDLLVVVASDTEPGAPDPARVIGAEPEAFAAGVQALRHLTAAPILLAQPEGPFLAPPGGHLQVVKVGAAHPAGLAGSVIARARSVGHGGMAWQIGYHDALVLGRLCLTGRLDRRRTVALAGDMAAEPRLIEVPEGAALEALAAAEARPGPRRVVSGSALSGKPARFLRRGQRQITLLPRHDPTTRPSRWLPQPRRALRPAPVIPHAALDAALGPPIPAMPLIRALSAGDAETADRLGVRALLEEDVALLTYLTGGTEDFAALLREVLDRLESGI